MNPGTKKSAQIEPVGPVPPPGADRNLPNAGSGDPAYSKSAQTEPVGPVPSPGASHNQPSTWSGNPEYKEQREPPPRRLRRLHRVWPDRDGNISYLLTICVEGRGRILDNEVTFERFVGFLLDSPSRYRWFGRRFVVMPDHIHVIARMGLEAERLGQWVKAMKAVVAGLQPRNCTGPAGVGPVPSSGANPTQPNAGSGDPAYNSMRRFHRIPRSWRWQQGYHDHKFRTPESETRKWEYICLNPVRYGLVKRPEDWPFGGEIFYDDAGGPRLVRGTPPLLETGILIQEDGRPRNEAPSEGTRPTT